MNPPCRLRDKMPVEVACSICGTKFTVRHDTYSRNGGDSHQWKCKRCAMLSMSNEDKEKRSNKIKESLNSKSEEEWKLMTEKRLLSLTQEVKEQRKLNVQKTWKDKSEEELLKISQRASDNTKNIWDKMDPAVKNKRINNLHEGFKNWYSALPEEEKEKLTKVHVDKFKRYYSNMTPEELKAHGAKTKRWYDSLSEEEKFKYNRTRGDGLLQYWKDQPDEKRIETKSRLNNAQEKWRNSLTEDEWNEHVRYTIIASAGKNNLSKLYELSINTYTQYKLEAEYLTEFNGIKHHWDYGVFDDNKLIAVVDLDGEYFHADKCDYDGIHSKYEYDYNRHKSIPPNIKHYIIREKYFEEDFQWLLHILPLSYEEFVAEEVKYLCTIPFPYQQYTDTELMKSWNKLCHMDVNSKYYSEEFLCHLGDRMIFHFCHSLYDERIWKPEWIEEAVRSHMIYHPHMNRNKLLLCVPHEEFTPPGQARINLKDHSGEYVDDKCDVGIMLGCIASNIPYCTTCTNMARYNEIQRILEWMDKYKINHENLIIKEGHE